MTAWASMTPRENIEARARLARNAARRARDRGDLAAASAQDRLLTRICGEAERHAAELAACPVTEGRQ